MSAPTCNQCGTPMETTSGIGTNGSFCPNPSCTGANGPTYQLNYTVGARALRRLTICYLQNPTCCGRPTTWDALRASYVCGVCHTAQ